MAHTKFSSIKKLLFGFLCSVLMILRHSAPLLFSPAVKSCNIFLVPMLYMHYR